jgi:CDP-glucose 4,6-dehydratase
MPAETFETNTLGTVNLLEACRDCADVRVIVNVTTDKVYENLSQTRSYRETDALGGHDPYSASKAASEIVTASYRDSFLAQRRVAVATARAGNVIGGGDWSEDRLLPDAARAWAVRETLQVRRPNAVRPWQHVLEACNGYLLLAQQLWGNPALAGAYNFGPETSETMSVRRIVELASTAFGEGRADYAAVESGPHEASRLVLDVGKARSVLGISPRWSIECAIQRTMAWYRDLQRGASAHALCIADITAYENEE